MSHEVDKVMKNASIMLGVLAVLAFIVVIVMGALYYVVYGMELVLGLTFFICALLLHTGRAKLAAGEPVMGRVNSVYYAVMIICGISSLLVLIIVIATGVIYVAALVFSVLGEACVGYLRRARLHLQDPAASSSLLAGANPTTQYAPTYSPYPTAAPAYSFEATTNTNYPPAATQPDKVISQV